MADRGYVPYVTKRLHIFLGCTALSEGCRYCWAAFQVHRQACGNGKDYRGLTKIGRDGYMWRGVVRRRWEELRHLKRWEGETVWVAPQSDPFHEDITDAEIVRYYSAIAASPKNTFILLTKRIERMHKLYTSGFLKSEIEKSLGRSITWPLKNTWEGVSIEDERTAQQRMPYLHNTPSCFPFISVQPQLGAVYLRPFLSERRYSWAVIGSEAGAMCRPVNPNHVFNVQHQLREAEVPYLTMCAPV